MCTSRVSTVYHIKYQHVPLMTNKTKSHNTYSSFYILSFQAKCLFCEIFCLTSVLVLLFQINVTSIIFKCICSNLLKFGLVEIGILILEMSVE